MLTQQEIAERLQEQHMFFGHMFFLPALGWQAPDEFFDEFLEDEDNDSLLEKAGFEMKYVREVRDGEMEKCDFPNWIIARSDDREPKNLEGWFVQVCANSLQWEVEKKEDGTFRQGTFSPGLTTWKWFYSPGSIDDIVEQAVVWRQEQMRKKWERQQKPLDEGGEEE